MKVEHLLLGAETATGHAHPEGATPAGFAAPFARAIEALRARAGGEPPPATLDAAKVPAADPDFLFFVDPDAHPSPPITEAAPATRASESSEPTPAMTALVTFATPPAEVQGTDVPVPPPASPPEVEGAELAPESVKVSPESAKAAPANAELDASSSPTTRRTFDGARPLHAFGRYADLASSERPVIGTSEPLRPDAPEVQGFGRRASAKIEGHIDAEPVMPSLATPEVPMETHSSQGFEPIELSFLVDRTTGQPTARPSEDAPSFAEELTSIVVKVAEEVEETILAARTEATLSPERRGPKIDAAPVELAPAVPMAPDRVAVRASPEPGSVAEPNAARGKTPPTDTKATPPETNPTPIVHGAAPIPEPVGRVPTVYERMGDRRPLAPPTASIASREPAPIEAALPVSASAVADAALPDSNAVDALPAESPPSEDGTGSATPQDVTTRTPPVRIDAMATPLGKSASIYAKIAENVGASAVSPSRAVEATVEMPPTKNLRRIAAPSGERQGNVDGVSARTLRGTSVDVAPEGSGRDADVRATNDTQHRSAHAPERLPVDSTAAEPPKDVSEPARTGSIERPIPAPETSEVASLRASAEPPPSPTARRPEEAPLAKAVTPSPFLKGLEQSENLAEATAARAIAQLRQGGPAVLDIEHPFHGPIRLEFAVDPRGIAVRAIALSEASARVIRATEPSLRENISRRGLVLKKLEVTVDGEDPSHASRSKVRRKGALSLEV